MSQVQAVDPALAAAAGASAGVAGAVSMAQEVVAQLFGVPLPVVLMAAAGAFGARSFLPPVGLWRAICESSLWTIAGAGCAQLVLAIANQMLSKEIPTGALAGVAMLTSSGLELLAPVIVPVLRQRVPELVNRWFDRLTKNDKGDGNA